MSKKEIATSPSTEYGHEREVVNYFANLLENRLAGRHKERIVKRMPVDECCLGVLLPWRREVDELDPAEVEEGAEGEVPEKTDGNGERTPAQEKNNPILREAAKAIKEDDKEGEYETASPQTEARSERDFLWRPPSSLGAEFLIEARGGKVEIEVDVSFAVYTPHLPTYKEQRESLGGTVDEEVFKGSMTLAEVWQRRTVSIEGIQFRIPGQADDAGLVQAELDRVIETALASPDVMPQFQIQPKLESEHLADECRFTEWLQEARRSNSQLRRPLLRAHIEVRSSTVGEGCFRLSVYLRNDTLRGQTRTEDNYHILGDARLRIVIIAGDLRPVEILPVPEDYQYDRKVWAVGHNSSVEVSDDKRTLETRTLARVRQPRITTQDDPPARFKDLDANPYEVLESIRHAMEAFAVRWDNEAIQKNILKLNIEFLAECQKDLVNFRDEISRFNRGIAALRSDPRLLDAFRGMNRVMDRLAKGKGFDRWRLFQIVFIVTQLPAIVLREGITGEKLSEGTGLTWDDELDWADVLWFPTGGGKTEAYLGLVSCAILYDRLRGKNLGLTAWLRFPLRMLSVQQLQRAMRMVWETEKERKSFVGAGSDHADPISLGYFVGGTTTPNRLDTRFFQRHPDQGSCEQFRMVADCPACDAENSIQAIPDPGKFRLRHICGVCHVEIPLFVTDSEIYRYLPSLLVGTVDKMATIGFRDRFGILWAGPRWKCPEHGYSYGDYCEVYGCEASAKKARQKVDPYDPSPTFHVQDELHLLQEELGAFAGHYETLTRFCEEANGRGKPAKVIAATATIEGYEHQAQQIYGVKRARRFPGRGYRRHESFFTTVEVDPDKTNDSKTARVFLAFRPPAGATGDVSGRCALILHEEIAKWIRNPYEGLAALPFLKSTDELWKIIHYYSTTLTYVNSLKSGTRIKDVLNNAAQEVHKGLRELNVEYLSGRSSSGEVSTVIHRMEQPPAWENQGYLDAIVATNMISHGVDLERINLMVMDKFPAEIAEYIQASSRSGRKKVGLITVVLPSFDRRAVSIYHRFREYHEHLDRMVSPVPVNRFAKYAVERTLPGILSGILFGLIGPETDDLSIKGRHKALAWIKSDPAKAEELLLRAYALGKGVYDRDLEEYHTKAIQDLFVDLRIALETRQEKYIFDAMVPKPMSSLRDVEQGVPFRPQSDDYVFLTWFRKDME